MIQNILKHLGGIEQYGIVSLCLFACVFAGSAASRLASSEALATIFCASAASIPRRG
jgi:hypothetical protein